MHLKFPSAEKFRAKTCRTMIAMCEARALANFATKDCVGGQNSAAVVLHVLQHRLCAAKKPLC
ncbi:hypothetical protein DIU36_26265 [Mucilaginibacter rubeus]|nr:hypothetical protein DIU36_26265 [Mucilaginibacter rubeus]